MADTGAQEKLARRDEPESDITPYSVFASNHRTNFQDGTSILTVQAWVGGEYIGQYNLLLDQQQTRDFIEWREAMTLKVEQMPLAGEVETEESS